MKLYTWDTPNGQKPVLLLEEIGAQYEMVPVNSLEGAQDDETFRAVNPNGKIPAMRD
ncbi:glutathione S-transferase N-terminal domain-containing protein, partial [Vibrio parahaemolyticus]